MAALSSVGPKPLSLAQDLESMSKIIQSFSDDQITFIAKIAAGFVVKYGASQFKPNAIVRYSEDEDGEIIELDVPVKLEQQAVMLIRKDLTENIHNAGFSTFAQGKELEFTFQNVLDTSAELQKQLNPDLYRDFPMTLRIEVNKGVPILVVVIKDRTEPFKIDP